MQRDRISVLFVIDNLLIGGAQELVKTLSLNLNKDIFSVAVCSLVDYAGKSAIEPLTREIEEGGVPVVTIRMEDWREPEGQKILLDLTREKAVDVLHVHLSPADLWMTRMTACRQVPVKLFTKHETYHNKSLPRRIANAYYFNKFYDCALAISDLSAEHLIKYEFILPWKVRKIVNPVDMSKFSPSSFSGMQGRRDLGIPPSAFVVGSVTRFVPRKGVEFFIQTAARVLRQVDDAWFVLVGYGETEDQLRKVVDELGLASRFVFAGPRRDIPRMLSCMDVFLFTPIWGESLPIVLLEAMAMGKAIVASNVCSNREIIAEGISGFLPAPASWASVVDNLDCDALAQAVVRFARSPSLREECGRNARRKAEQVYDIHVIVKQLEDLYRELLTPGKVKSGVLGSG